MAPSPFAKLARVFAGVALARGGVGHQVLGQLLIFDASDVGVAAATTAVTAVSGDTDAALQIAVRTAAPALAVRALLRRREQRLARLTRTIARQAEALATRERKVEAGLGQLDATNARADALALENEALKQRIAALLAMPPAGATRPGEPG